MRLIYFSPVPFFSFSQRPHKFVEWLHKKRGSDVLWIDPYPTRFPVLKDLRLSRPTVETNRSDSVPEWLTLLKPGGLPIEPLPRSFWVNRLFWRNDLRMIENFAETASTLLVIGKPSVLAVELLKRLRHCRSLYDAMDDFPAFYSGFSRFALARREYQVARQVDAIWVSSSGLESRWRDIHNDVRLVPNALDISPLEIVSPALRSSGKKVFGYVGTIASWFDWRWVCELARARPDDEIRLIGPLFDPPDDILPENVNLLPACDHATALKAMMQFDAALIPFKKNQLTSAVDPIKYYEYRSLGLPVISTDFGEMRNRKSERGVFISHELNDLAGLAELALQFDSNPGEAAEFAIQNTWEARFDRAGLLS